MLPIVTKVQQSVAVLGIEHQKCHPYPQKCDAVHIFILTLDSLFHTLVAILSERTFAAATIDEFMVKTMVQSRRERGFSLLELSLVLVLMVAASLAVYRLFGVSQVDASVRQEQEHASHLVDSIVSAYTTANNFSTISTATVAGVLNLPLSANALPTALKKDLSVRPATTKTPNDSFELVYSGLSTPECLKLSNALSSQSSGLFVGSSSNLQTATGAINDEAQLTALCASSSSNTVAFRYTGNKTTFAATTMDSCLCAPESETQTLACASGSSGSITQRRTGTCTGGTASCPSLQWSSWVTASNTCGANAAVTPSTAVAPVAPQTCAPSVETQNVPCGTNQVGTILQQRSRTCPANTWGAWSNVSSSCQPASNRAACTPSTQRQTAACPAGQGGQIVQERASTCDANGNELWSNDWKNISSTCTASCVASGTCCTVGRQTGTEVRQCGAGTYGVQTASLQRTSTCASATSTPVWPGSWTTTSINGTCTACPAPTQDQENQVVATSAPCPAGQTGSHTWNSHQTRTRMRSYSCPAGTASLPAPTIAAWGSWVETSRSSESNTCTAACSGPTGKAVYSSAGWSSLNDLPTPSTACSSLNLGQTAFIQPNARSCRRATYTCTSSGWILQDYGTENALDMCSQSTRYGAGYSAYGPTGGDSNGDGYVDTAGVNAARAAGYIPGWTLNGKVGRSNGYFGTIGLYEATTYMISSGQSHLNSTPGSNVAEAYSCAKYPTTVVPLNESMTLNGRAGAIDYSGQAFMDSTVYPSYPTCNYTATFTSEGNSVAVSQSAGNVCDATTMFSCITTRNYNMGGRKISVTVSSSPSPGLISGHCSVTVDEFK